MTGEWLHALILSLLMTKACPVANTAPKKFVVQLLPHRGIFSPHYWNVYAPATWMPQLDKSMWRTGQFMAHK